MDPNSRHVSQTQMDVDCLYTMNYWMQLQDFPIIQARELWHLLWLWLMSNTIGRIIKLCYTFALKSAISALGHRKDVLPTKIYETQFSQINNQW